MREAANSFIDQTITVIFFSLALILVGVGPVGDIVIAAIIFIVIDLGVYLWKIRKASRAASSRTT